MELDALFWKPGWQRDPLVAAVKAHFRWRRGLPPLLEPYPHLRSGSHCDVERFLADVG